MSMMIKNTMATGAELTQIMDLCKILGSAPYYQKMGAAGVLSIWLLAREMGLPPMGCLNGGMYTFSGQVTISAQFMNMLITNAGHRAEVLRLDETGCKIKFFRADTKKTFDYEFTKQDAERAGYLTKDVWKKHPRDMYFSRCISGGARKFMPDVIMGAYVQGELDSDIEVVPVMPNIQIEDRKTEEFQEPALILINESQIEEIHEILRWIDEEVKISLVNRILAKYKIESLKNIPFANFPTVIKFLKSETSEKENDS